MRIRNKNFLERWIIHREERPTFQSVILAGVYDISSYGYGHKRDCRICQIMKEEKERTWTKAVFLEAMKKILTEKNTLFESLVNKLTRYPKLKEVLYTILFQEKEIPYNALNESIEVVEMLGFIRNEENKVVVDNRIFETVLYNLFLSEEVVGNRIYADFLL